MKFRTTCQGQIKCQKDQKASLNHFIGYAKLINFVEFNENFIAFQRNCSVAETSIRCTLRPWPDETLTGRSAMLRLHYSSMTDMIPLHHIWSIWFTTYYGLTRFCLWFIKKSKQFNHSNITSISINNCITTDQLGIQTILWANYLVH